MLYFTVSLPSFTQSLEDVETAKKRPLILRRHEMEDFKTLPLNLPHVKMKGPRLYSRMSFSIFFDDILHHNILPLTHPLHSVYCLYVHAIITQTACGYSEKHAQVVIRSGFLEY